MFPDGIDGLLLALNRIMWLAMFLFVSGFGSRQLDAPPEEESWYQYEGAFRGL